MSQAGYRGQDHDSSEVTNAWSTWNADASDRETRERLERKRDSSIDGTQKPVYVLNDIYRKIEIDQKSQARRITNTTRRVLEDSAGSLAPSSPSLPFTLHLSTALGDTHLVDPAFPAHEEHYTASLPRSHPRSSYANLQKFNAAASAPTAPASESNGTTTKMLTNKSPTCEPGSGDTIVKFGIANITSAVTSQNMTPPPVLLVSAPPFADFLDRGPNDLPQVSADRSPTVAVLSPLPTAFPPTPVATNRTAAATAPRTFIAAPVSKGDTSEDLISFD